MRSRLIRSLSLLALSLAILAPICTPIAVAARKPIPPPLVPPFTLSLAASSWTTITKNLHKFPLSNLGDGSLAWQFPSGPTFADAGSLDYLYTVQRADLSTAQSIGFDLAIYATGSPIFKYDTEPSNTCVYPAHARLFFWSRLDVQGGGGMAWDRWWSLDGAVELASGSFHVEVPLDPTRWSDVAGHAGDYDAATSAGWLAALADVSRIGMTFGGGCFFSHGTYTVNGTAQGNLQRLAVQ